MHDKKMFAIQSILQKKWEKKQIEFYKRGIDEEVGATS